jgi:hypothetical protein
MASADPRSGFLWAYELPFTNNETERAFRMMKVRVKISGCFRTLEERLLHTLRRLMGMSAKVWPEVFSRRLVSANSFSRS